jgi:hypothetical protein
LSIAKSGLPITSQAVFRPAKYPYTKRTMIAPTTAPINRLIGSRHDELGDNARDKPDDDRPDDTHLAFLDDLRV